MPPPVGQCGSTPNRPVNAATGKCGRAFVNLTANTHNKSLVAKPVPSVTSSRTRQSSKVVSCVRWPANRTCHLIRRIGTQRSDKMFAVRKIVGPEGKLDRFASPALTQRYRPSSQKTHNPFPAAQSRETRRAAVASCSLGHRPQMWFGCVVSGTISTLRVPSVTAS